MTVLAVGDSISFGYELGDIPGPPVRFGNTFYDVDTMTCKPLYASQLAYPKLLADLLGTDCKNLSLVGGSNDRTFRLTVDQILQQRYDLVICNWTSIDRFDFTCHGQDIALTVGTSQWQIEQFPWFKSFIADHYDSDQMTQRFFANLIALQALLKKLEQPYIFVNGCCDLPSIPDYKHYTDYIDQTQCFAWGTNLNQWCQRQQLEFGPEGHFLEAGHQLVAQELYNAVKELYL
jgi:hypothetical protein